MIQKVATVFGWAEAAPQSELYGQGVQLGRALAASGYTVRCGGYFGLMEAVACGVSQEGGECVGICLEAFEGKQANQYLTSVEWSSDLFDRLRGLIVGSDLVIAQHGSLGTIAEVAVAWCLRYLGHPDVGSLHLIGDGWKHYHASMGSLEVKPADAARGMIYPTVASFVRKVLLPESSNEDKERAVEMLSFEVALARLDEDLARYGRLREEVVSALGAKNAVEFGCTTIGGLELQQRPEEVVPLLSMLVDRYRSAGTIRYLEIGLGHGATTILVSRLFGALGVKCVLTGVEDFSYERNGWVYGQTDRLKWCESELALRLLNGSLRDRKIREVVTEDTYDIVFVDADHSFGGCLHDVLSIVECLASNGTLVLHDVADSENTGVRRVLDMLIPHFAQVDLFVGDGDCGVAALSTPLDTFSVLDLVASALG
jgi:uncharacterized protein (TIGR00725 family)